MPNVSIIVPIYNSEEYLEECIASILNQTYKNFELILINDGSTDRSQEICELYKNKDPRVITINKKNEGVSETRNHGIKAARGKYILFVDSDDIVSKDWIEVLYKTISKYEKNLIISGYCTKSKSSSQETKTIFSENELNSIINKKDFFLIYEKHLINSPCNKIYRASILKKYDIKFKKDISLGEDLLFNLEYLKYIDSIILINKPLYNCIVRENESLSRKYYKNLFEICNLLHTEIYKAMTNFGTDINIYRKNFYLSYLNYLILVLNNTFNKKCTLNLVEKIKYNTCIMKSDEFRKCIKYSDLSGFSSKYISILKSKNYIYMYIYIKLYNIKSKINNNRGAIDEYTYKTYK